MLLLRKSHNIKMIEYSILRKKAQEHRDELCRMLAELASFPSLQSDPEPHAPYGFECARLLERVEELMKNEGLATKLNADDGYLLGKLGSGNKIGIFAHGDVVPVGEGWTLTSPFEPKMLGDFMVGRGVSDNKSGIINAIFALRVLRELGAEPSCGVTIFVGSNEESGMGDIRAFAQKEAMPAVNIVPDCAYPAGRGEKGILRFYAVSREGFDGITELSGGEAFNIILGKAEAIVNASISADDIACEAIEQGTKLVATGISKHAASPEGSKNAGKLLIDALASSTALCESDRRILKNAAAILEGYYGEGLGIESIDPDFGHLTCANGIIKLNQKRLMLSFDVRYGASIDGSELEKQIIARLDSLGFDFKLESNRAGFIIDEDNEYLCAVADAYRECTGNHSSKTVLNGGGTYARYLKNGISVGSHTWHSPDFELPVGHGGAHQPDEFISIDGILDSIAILAYTICKLEKL